MGPNLTDNATGVFWAAFALFAATTASIMSGAVIERIRLSAFIILAVLLGSAVWILGGSWGCHPEGWLTTQFGYHDTGAAGVVHMVAGFFTLGVLINLGPRIGRFATNGTVQPICGHSTPMSIIGLMLIVVGLFGFLGGCIIYVTGDQWVTIYDTPATLSSFAFNTLMGSAGGIIIGAYLITRDPFWMMSGGLAGIISAASGLDLYYPRRPSSSGSSAVAPSRMPTSYCRNSESTMPWVHSVYMGSGVSSVSGPAACLPAVIRTSMGRRLRWAASCWAQW